MKNYSPNIQYFVIILNGWKTGGLEAREDQENEAFKKKIHHSIVDLSVFLEISSLHTKWKKKNLTKKANKATSCKAFIKLRDDIFCQLRLRSSVKVLSWARQM